MNKLLKCFLVSLTVGVLSFAAFAGPTVSLGVAWWGDEPVIGPGIGIKGDIGEGLGLEFSTNFSMLDIETGPPWSVEFGSFTELCLLTRLPSAVGGPYWNAVLGLGVPGLFEADKDATTFEGFGLGLVLGVSFEGKNGNGVAMKSYWNGEIVGFGFVGYVDIFGFTGPLAE